MRRWRPFGGLLCFLLILLGVLIMFVLFLPPGFWWFMLGVSLIAGGYCCSRRR